MHSAVPMQGYIVHRRENVKGTGNIIFCGVGGQGVLLASEVTADALMLAGFDIKRSEVHGMAQRGGSVIAHLRYGDKVYSPLIDPGTADIQVSFEMLESLRYIQYLHKGSKVVINTLKLPPVPVSTGVVPYPPDILKTLRKKNLDVYPVDAFEIGRTLGEVRSSNIVIVGALSSLLTVDEECFIKAIRERVPPGFLAVNLRAFEKGRAVTKSS